MQKTQMKQICVTGPQCVKRSMSLCAVSHLCLGGLQTYEQSWKQGRLDEIETYNDAVAAEKKEQWRAEGQKDLFAAKKENVGLQLEAAYRERLLNAYNEVRWEERGRKWGCIWSMIYMSENMTLNLNVCFRLK
jgi:hypothetical protein